MFASIAKDTAFQSTHPHRVRHDFRLAMEILTKKASDVDVLNDIAGEVIVENKEKLLANASSDEVREYIEKEYIEKIQEQ